MLRRGFLEDVCSATVLRFISMLALCIVQCLKKKWEGSYLSIMVIIGEMSVAEMVPAVRSAVKCSAS